MAEYFIEKSPSDKITSCLAPYERKTGLQFLGADKKPVTTPQLTEGKNQEGYFYIQYQNKDLAGQGKIQVDMRIGPQGFPKILAIDLFENPPGSGCYVSLPLALVPSYDLVDQMDGDKVIPIVAKLGDRIQVTYDGKQRIVDCYTSGRPTHIVPLSETLSVKIPVEKVFNYQTVVFVGSEKPFDEDKREIYQDKIETDLALKGIQAKETDLKIIPLPPGINLEDGLNPREMRRLVRHVNKTYPDAPKAKMLFVGDDVLMKSRMLNSKNFFVSEGGLTPDQIETIQRSPYLEKENETVGPREIIPRAPRPQPPAPVGPDMPIRI
ncbi:MAG: hypothetical protein K1X66_00735 [Verrucomicrobiae bacterium]|nr:hypothetical protein [Verrucomicrobiae bacterium]